MRALALLLTVLSVVASAGCGVEIRTYERVGVAIHHLVVGIGNVWVLETPDGVVTVDLAEKGDADEIIQGLAQLGYAPGDVALGIVTHGHMDHAGPGKRMQQEGMRIALHADDVEIVETGSSPPPQSLTLEGDLARNVLDVNFPPWTPDVVLDDNTTDLSVYGIPGRLLHTPGHSKGSVVVVLDSGDAFVGDVARGDDLWIGGKGNHEGEAKTHAFSENEAADRDHLDALLGMGVTTFFPGHGAYFGAESLRGWLADRALELGELDERPAR